jgi:hypothetical protein
MTAGFINRIEPTIFLLDYFHLLSKTEKNRRNQRSIPSKRNKMRRYLLQRFSEGAINDA